MTALANLQFKYFLLRQGSHCRQCRLDENNDIQGRIRLQISSHDA